METQNKNVFFAHNSTSIKENEFKQFISKIDKEQIRTNKSDIAWLKENGVGGGGGGNLDNYYDKQETDQLILDVKKLTTGVAFTVRLNDWILIDGYYTYQLNHNLAIALQSFSIGFYVEHASAIFDYKYLTEDSLLIYSDEPVHLTVVVKQSVEASTTVPKEVLDNIEANTTNLIACENAILENAAKIDSNTLDITQLKARPEIDMSNYYTKEDVYNKAEVYNSSEVYSKLEVDRLISNGSSPANTNDYGTISKGMIGDYPFLEATDKSLDKFFIGFNGQTVRMAFYGEGTKVGIWTPTGQAFYHNDAGSNVNRPTEIYNLVNEEWVLSFKGSTLGVTLAGKNGVYFYASNHDIYTHASMNVISFRENMDQIPITKEISLQHKRGSSAKVNAYKGKIGEIVVNTDDFSIKVMDGVTPGGHSISGTSNLENYYTKMQTDNMVSQMVEKESGKTLISENKLLLIDNHELDISSNKMNIDTNKTNIERNSERIVSLDARVEEAFQHVSNGKTLLETAITDKGGTVSKVNNTATFEELATGINTITTTDIAGKQIILDAILFKMPELKGQLTIDNTWEQYAYYIKLIGPKNIEVEDRVSLTTVALDNKLLTRDEVNITHDNPIKNGLEDRLTLTAISATNALTNDVVSVVLTPIE